MCGKLMCRMGVILYAINIVAVFVYLSYWVMSVTPPQFFSSQGMHHHRYIRGADDYLAIYS